jgi:hypothetical protein
LAGVDLGSKGAKGALFYFAQEPDGPAERVVYGRTINHKLVSSMNGEQFTEAGIEDAADAVKDLIDEMKARAKKEGFQQVEYFVVGSSGVAKGKNKADLVVAIKKASGIDIEFVSAKREGYYGLISSVPPRRRNVALYVDIGSGNTKLGCLVGSSDLADFRDAEIPFGLLSLRNLAAEENSADLVAGIQKVVKEKLRPAYERESLDTPCLRNRQRIYWTGGAAWATATFMHPERSLRPYVVITKQDLDAFASRLNDGSWNQKPLEYSFPADASAGRQKEVRDKAEQDRNDVMNTFVREDLLSGIAIVKSVLGASNPSAILQFVRSGNYLYGYAREKFKEDRDLDDPDN